MRRHWIFFVLVLALLLLSLPVAQAKNSDDDDDGHDDDDADNGYYEKSRDSLVEPLFGAVALIALIPMSIAAMAYRRTENQRMLFLTVAFLLFALNGLLMSLEHRLEGYGISDEDVEFWSAIVMLATIGTISMTMFRK